LVAEFVGHEFHIRIDVLEEAFVARAKVIQPGLAVGRADEAMLGALTVAGKADIASAAITGQ
jgi:hypothetical protein